jgi:hypothetical protein
MSETHSPVLVRMTNELKSQLKKSAAVHGRTLTGEIVQRLSDSFKTPQPGIAPSSHSHGNAPLATVLRTGDATHNSLEQAMLKAFQALPVEKQLSLLTLLKS